jgi:hypothetical protein
VSSRRLVLASIALLVTGAACHNNVVHPFSAWAYDPTRDCLEAPAVVDVLSGPDDGPCKQLRCWESAGGDIYITDTACSAPPDYKNETNQKAGACSEAIQVYGRAMHGQCPAGTGGSGGGVIVTSP